jgi:aspartate carbamoyltransferase catalytic subunit
LDLYSIWQSRGHIEQLRIGFLGDLKFGRAVHSLAKLLGLYNTHFYFISHPTLEVPADIVKKVINQGCEVTETDDLINNINKLDVLYVTRVQKERFPDLKTYENVKSCYRIDAETMKKAKSSLSLLHPLPRLDEIAVDVDKDPRAKYFEQVSNGVAVRMALLALVSGRLGDPSKKRTIGI